MIGVMLLSIIASLRVQEADDLQLERVCFWVLKQYFTVIFS